MIYTFFRWKIYRSMHLMANLTLYYLCRSFSSISQLEYPSTRQEYLNRYVWDFKRYATSKRGSDAHPYLWSVIWTCRSLSVCIIAAENLKYKGDSIYYKFISSSKLNQLPCVHHYPLLQFVYHTYITQYEHC